jgi:hypothetical protein
LAKLKDIEIKMLVNTGLKGGSNYADQEIKKRINEVID